MVAVVRAVSWIVGSLSVAVMFRQAFDVSLASAVRPVLGTYERTVQAAFAAVEPPINTFVLPHVAAFAGSGTTLLAHWPYVFLVALLHMWPRPGASGGMTALQWGQAIGATVLAFVGALTVGSLTFFSGVASTVIALFAIGALAANWLPELPTKGGMVADDVDDVQPPYDVFAAVTVLLIALGIGGVSVGLGRATVDEVWALWPLAVFLAWLAWFVGFVMAGVQALPRIGRRFRDPPVTHVARLALFALAWLASLGVVGPSNSAFNTGGLLLFAGFTIATAIVLIPRLLRGDDEIQLPPPPALGVFLAGGAAIMIANHYLL